MAFKLKNDARRTIVLPTLLSLLVALSLPAGNATATSLAITVAGTNGAAAKASGMSLAEAIVLTISRHPAMQGRQAQLQGAQARIGAAESAYYPQVGMDINHSLTAPGNANQSSGVSVTASQLLYDFGKTASAVEAAKKGKESMAEQLSETRLAIAESVAVLYNDRLRYAKLIEVMERNYAMLQDIREVSELRANAGLNSRSDIQLADVRMSDVHAARISYRAQLRSVESRLASLLGMTQAQLPAFAPLPAGLIGHVRQSGNGDWSMAPQVRAAIANMQAAQAQVKSAEAGLLPSVHLRAGTSGLNPLSSHAGYSGRNNSLMLVLRSDNLFEGGAGKARVEAAVAQVAAAQAEVDSLKLDMEQKSSDLLSELSGSLDRAQVYGSQSGLATLERDTYREEYTLGKRTLNNLLDAQRNIMNAQTQCVSSEYDAARSALKLARLTQILPAYVAGALASLPPADSATDRQEPARSASDTIVETYIAMPGKTIPAERDQQFPKEKI